MDNLTAVLHKTNDLRVENTPIPVPKDDEVLLKMNAVGVCGSDVHYVVHGRIAHFVVEKPMIIGHEASGTVIKCGKDVKGLKVGDRVAIEPGYGCRKCDYCKGGKYNLCPDMIFCATPPYDGNLRRYYCHPYDFCFKLPDHVSDEEGACLEPLSVGVHACRTAGIEIGDNVLIIGAGPIGLVNLLVAKAMGASKIVVTDVIDCKLEKAMEMGATKTINTSAKDINMSKLLRDIFGDLPNKTIDCVGFESTVRTGIEVTRSGGVLVVVGLGAAEVNIPIANALAREVAIKGVFRYCNDYPIALDLIASRRVNVNPLITHHYKIEETLDAIETCKTGRGGAIKVMIHCNEDWKK